MNAEVGASIVVKNDSFHHLVNVVRVKKTESVKIFNGKGLEVLCGISSIEKKQLTLVAHEVQVHQKPKLGIDVLIGTPKKEALEQCLKAVVELGIGELYLAETEYAQKNTINPERQMSLLTSSIEQSNNPFFPVIHEIKSQEIDLSVYEQVVLFDSVNTGTENFKVGTNKVLIVVGPEGGFSESELNWWKSHPQTTTVHLPTAIMRTPTALSCGIGFTLGKLS